MRIALNPLNVEILKLLLRQLDCLPKTIHDKEQHQNCHLLLNQSPRYLLQLLIPFEFCPLIVTSSRSSFSKTAFDPDTDKMISLKTESRKNDFSQKFNHQHRKEHITSKS